MNRPDETRENEDARELFERFERDFQQRAASGAEPRDAERVSGFGAPYEQGAPPFAPRQSVRLSLPLSRPRVVYVILVLNIIMYGVTLLLSATQGYSFNESLFVLGGKFGPAIDAGQYWRFFTPMILHGGLIHLLFNSYALYALGPENERIYGSGRFLAIYLMAGFAGTLASYIRSPGLSIGASGAIFGLIGSLAAFFYSARSLLGAEASRERVNQLIGLAAVNIVLGFTLPGIDNAAHIGGLIAGGIAGFALSPQFRVDDRLYPPVVVRADRPAVSWLFAGILAFVLIAIAIAAVGLR